MAGRHFLTQKEIEELMNIVNAWILHQRVHKSREEKDETKYNTLSLWKFKSELSETLCKQGFNKTNKRGRLSQI